jgi:AcrR family transcriptional regulator
MPRIKPETQAARRRQILDAAELCFARDGFHRATIQDVITRSGLSAGCIYGHFKSKADLIESISARRHVRDTALLDAAQEQPEGLPGLRAIARTFLEDLQSTSGARARRVGLGLWAEALHDAVIRRQVTEGVKAPLARIEALVRRAQTLSVIDRAIDAPALARLFVALIQGIFLQRAWGEVLDLDASMRVFDAMLGGLMPRQRA